MSKPTEAAEIFARIAGVHDAIGDALAPFGGFIRCETCRDQIDITSDRAARYTASGWPRCHGETMRWWTQRQIDAGEVTA